MKDCVVWNLLLWKRKEHYRYERGRLLPLIHPPHYSLLPTLALQGWRLPGLYQRKSKVSLQWTCLYLQLIHHMEACHTADFHANFVLKSLTVDWYNHKNTCYYSRPFCNSKFSEVYAERCPLLAHLYGLNHLDCSCYFEINHKTFNMQTGYIIKTAAIKQTYKCQKRWKGTLSQGRNHLKTS